MKKIIMPIMVILSVLILCPALTACDNVKVPETKEEAITLFTQAEYEVREAELEFVFIPDYTPMHYKGPSRPVLSYSNYLNYEKGDEYFKGLYFSDKSEAARYYKVFKTVLNENAKQNKNWVYWGTETAIAVFERK